jgi:PAS domain S-box-containing protein
MAAKILNVDDHEINRYIRSQTLKAAGYEVVEASNGAEALDSTAREQPELVLLDINMPDINGIEVCRRIKANQSATGPIIVLQISASATGTDDHVRGLEGGADGYLTEPVAPELLLAIVRSMLRLRRAEQEVRERDARLRRLVSSNVVGIAIADPDRVKDANDEYLRIIGATRQQLLDGKISWREITPDDHLSRDLSAMEELRERGTCTPFEKEYVFGDGRRTPILIGAATLSQDPHEWICFVVDMSEQRRAETQLKERTRELARSNEELQRFAYFLSHDLQTPLRTVASMTQMLVQRYGGVLDAEGHEIAKFIGSGVQRMSGLIKDLLEYASFSETGSHAPAPVDATAAAQWAVANLQAQIGDSAAEIAIDRPLPMVRADHQLSRVFQNLIGNAIKYRSRRPLAVRIWGQCEDGNCLFAVRDNGIGFDMQYAEKIFNPFQRLHGPDEYEGSGIGLAICKKVIEGYGGRMWAESVVGQGSTFFFTVPLSQSAISHA